METTQVNGHSATAKQPEGTTKLGKALQNTTVVKRVLAGIGMYVVLRGLLESGGDGMTEWGIERTPYESEIDIVSDGRVIATVEAGEGQEKVAQILVAAPDMLEALETIMDIGDKACRDIARAAIRKARGEE